MTHGTSWPRRWATFAGMFHAWIILGIADVENIVGSVVGLVLPIGLVSLLFDWVLRTFLS